MPTAGASPRPEDATLLGRTARLVTHLLGRLDLPIAVRLWDGRRIAPDGAASDLDEIRIAGPGAVRALLRRPTLDTLFRLYVTGAIEPTGGDLLALMDRAQGTAKKRRGRLRRALAGFPWNDALRLALVQGTTTDVTHAFAGDAEARDTRSRDDRRLVQFHYDASNDFYRLFLDAEMVYSCAYFESFGDDIDTAQRAKLDLICRKLRLRPGERLLDIGCGWGALICHAARHYGVTAHGVTLSQAQFDQASAKVESLGLAGRVTVALQDYRTLEGQWDKIASIGMYEHVGIDTYPTYFKTMGRLLAPDGIFLNHGITRRAKKERKAFRRPSASRRIILRYIFPGAELDHIGHTLEVMEAAGLEIHDVEGLRRHYARTCRIWYERLMARREAAIEHVGAERFRMWAAYLAGVAIGFDRGPLRLFQVVATHQSRDGTSPLPPTRADLYDAGPCGASPAPAAATAAT